MRERRNDIALINVGATFATTDNLSLYAGVGYASADGYAKKYDSSHILGSDGIYYTPDTARDESGVNFNGGLIITGQKYGVNLGYNSYNSAIYVGLGAKF
ncbi:hypothetical protein [Marinobacterium sp. xm-d-420]|uniref:hypothetical protein n=1 Tax=Marinobacterium sp. xm-d-420 TaxID=2497737 RepID=UPI0015699657|nr:hypothetical protein [Marinobacterium sp. xm-d-420]